mgnify:CR=1 FL=1
MAVNKNKVTNKFFQSVIEVSHIEFSAYDLKNRALIYTSGLAAQILGYTEEQMQEFGKDYNRNIIHPDDLEQVNTQLTVLENARPGQIVEMIVRYRRNDGRYIWGYTRKMVTEWENEKPSKMTVVAEDITELVSLQIELEKKVEELEKIHFRNHHDLKGPVASILGLANLMQDDSLISEHNREIISHLSRTVAKLDSVVADIAAAED